MIDIQRIFQNYFATPEISDSELKDFAKANLQAMETNNPANAFTERITATRTAYKAFDTGTSTHLTILGQQKARTLDKNIFLKTLPKAIGKIYNAVAVVYGEDSPEMTECFPEGRGIFTRCKHDDKHGKLQTLINGLSTKVPPLSQTVLDSANALQADWMGIYQAQGTAKGMLRGASDASGALRTALELELCKNVLTIALHFVADSSKATLYFPQSLLRNRSTASSEEPQPTPPTPSKSSDSTQPK